MKMRKWIQRLILDSLILNPTPIAGVIFLTCVFGTVFSIGFLVGHWIDQLSLDYLKIYDATTDNIGGRSPLYEMGNMFPIDVVYTWVNGTDPLVISNLKLLTNYQKFSCKLANCFPSTFIAIESTEKGSYFYNYASDISYIKTVELRKNISSTSFDVYHIDEGDLSPKELIENFQKRDNASSSMQILYWTSDNKSKYTVQWSKTFMIRVESTDDLHLEISNYSPDNFKRFTEVCSPTKHFDTYLVQCTDEDIVRSILDDIHQYKDSHPAAQFPKVWVANLVLQSESRNQETGVNRFEENEELRYSLRSLEKFAPWVRKVFLVTNGQVPYWVNLDNPRLILVTHDDIFEDLTHLPTFSSPAIEANLHRIPGLSDNFLYLNDDVMFGSRVWPDDFYSTSTGYKIYLAWSLPDCSPGCPSNWVSDGYCDSPCNNSKCDWDGGDCKGRKGHVLDDEDTLVESQDSNQWDDLCTSSCVNSWLADSFCDTACMTPACGFDVGDCGLDSIKRNMYEVPISWAAADNRTYTLPRGVLSAFVDISPLMKNEVNATTKGHYGQTRGVRSAAINVPLKVLVLVFNANTNGTVRLGISLVAGKKKEIKKSVNFNIKFNTLFINVTSVHEDYLSKPKNGANESNLGNSPKILKNSVNEQIIYDSNLSQLGASDISVNDSIFRNLDSNAKSVLNSELNLLYNRFKDNELTIQGYKYKKHLLFSQFIESKITGHINYTNKNNSVERLNNSNQNFKRRKLFSIPFESLNIQSSEGTLNQYYGNLPWENDVVLRTELKGKYRTSVKSHNLGRRSLLEAYGDSLLFVNKLYNSIYGSEARRVPAHMPHFINKNILQEIIIKFRQEFLVTSSHRIRDSDDMQFAFTYFHYLINEKYRKPIDQVFDDIDTDKSGTWSDREIRTLLTKTHDLPLFYELFQNLHEDIRNCSERVKPKPVSAPPFERYVDTNIPVVSKELVLKCSNSLTWQIIDKLRNVSKFPHTMMSDNDVHFKMITSNVSTVVERLDDVRKNPRKFICLNSNLDPNSKDNELIKALLQDTFEALHPIPSSFELQPGYRNRFSYIWEWKDWLKWRNFVRAVIYGLFSCLILLTLSSISGFEIENVWRKWCKRRRNRLLPRA